MPSKGKVAPLVKSTDTIPKVDRVEYLFEALGWIEENLTFDEVREALIGLRLEDDEQRLLDLRSGGRSVQQFKDKQDVKTFWSNARDVFRELMRLGLVCQDSLPSRPAQLDGHRGRTFRLTNEGTQFLELAKRNVLEFRCRFAESFLIAHPYARKLQRRLSEFEMFLPRIQRADLPGDVDTWQHGVPEPLIEVANAVAASVLAATGDRLKPEQLESYMRPYLTAAWRRPNTEQARNEFSKSVIKTVNDVVIRSLVDVHGMQMDYVTFRSVVNLLGDLHALWHTRALGARKGWTIWSTSTGDWQGNEKVLNAAATALAGPRWFKPSIPRAEDVRDCIISTFLSLDDRPGGFAPIHVLRAEVCHKLQIHGRDFNAVLRSMHAQELRHSKFAINLDRAGVESLLPSEEPFRVGNRPFYLITLLRRE